MSLNTMIDETAIKENFDKFAYGEKKQEEKEDKEEKPEEKNEEKEEEKE